MKFNWKYFLILIASSFVEIIPQVIKASEDKEKPAAKLPEFPEIRGFKKGIVSSLTEDLPSPPLTVEEERSLVDLAIRSLRSNSRPSE